MANVYKNAGFNLSTTNLTTVYTCPSGTTSTIIGLYLCNQSGGSIEGTAQFFDSSSSTHISLTHGTPIPSGTTIVAVGGDGKVVLEATDEIKIDCSVADKVSGTLSIMEIT